ncbi:MAG: polysaccharide deacetylase [Sphingobium sp.]
MPKDIQCGFSVHVDAVAAWLGTFGGADSPHDISRGMFAGEVGTPRLLDLFDRLGIKTSWFIPGHSIETFPDQMQDVVKRGHEVGLHGYSHENPLAMTRRQEEDVFDRCISLIEKLSGRKPRGFAAPWWEHSASTPDILMARGIKYDSSMMHHDHECYRLRASDTWTPIDYSQSADTWMKPLKRGRETALIEIPASWYLDDLPPMMFIKKAPNSHGFMNPKDIEDLWLQQFDWVYRNYDHAVFVMTLHPDVAGRPQVLLMLERICAHIMGHSGARFITNEEMADDFDRRHPLRP